MATATISAKPPVWYWVVSIAGLLFTLFGVFSLFGAITHQDQIEHDWGSKPSAIYWVEFSVGVIAEVIGVAGLLTRKAWAVPAFAVSLAFTILYAVYIISKTPTASQVVFTTAAIVLPHAILLGFAFFSRARGWFGHGA